MSSFAAPHLYGGAKMRITHGLSLLIGIFALGCSSETGTGTTTAGHGGTGAGTTSGTGGAGTCAAGETQQPTHVGGSCGGSRRPPPRERGKSLI